MYLGEGGRRHRTIGLSQLDPEPHFDLVIVDEAHHIRNGSMEKEKAFAYKCTKYFCDHADAVVMLTATPLQTGSQDLYTLLNVLRPDLVIDPKTFDVMARPNGALSLAVRAVRTAQEGWSEAAHAALLEVRKTQWGDNVIAENPLYHDILRRLNQGAFTREERVTLIHDIESLHSFHSILNRTRRRDIQDFCVRRPHTVSVAFTDVQQKLHDELLSFERFALSVLHDPRSVSFLLSTLRRQAASCIFGLAPFIRDIIERRIQQLNDDPEVDYALFDWNGMGGDALSAQARALVDMAEHLPEEDPKFDATWHVIQAKQGYENNKIMLFSTFRHTLAYLKRRLSELGCRVEQIDGSVKDEVRYRLKERFELPRQLSTESIDNMLMAPSGIMI